MCNVIQLEILRFLKTSVYKQTVTFQIIMELNLISSKTLSYKNGLFLKSYYLQFL